MPFVTTNFLTLSVVGQLNKRWSIDGDASNKCSVRWVDLAGDKNCKSGSYLSLPIEKRMEWVLSEVIPAIQTQQKRPQTAIHARLASVGADHLYPHADKLDVFRMRSVGY